ncbi:ABC transporter permease [Salinispira pacifica]|uniref:Lipoprotein releasing system transmembrane protein LolC n=1 Tax=Salinispira pacifica TaxID=1307761 RepID=V5WEL4_9SPIO|nr:ABC transporter permease [Salinispira pacifica]AHC14253.1 Lipoprotein releasing system transmembrane protein LolC [Salinispira pacifica]
MIRPSGHNRAGRRGFRRMEWILFIAGRLLKSRRKSRSSVTASLSILGLAVGVLTMITVISVMNGFQMNTIEDLIELNSFHLRIPSGSADDQGEVASLPDLPSSQELEELRGVSMAFPIIETQALVQGYFSGTQSIILKGIDPELLSRDGEFARRLKLEQGTQIPGDSIILGRELARFLGVQQGDYIQLTGLGGDSISLREPVSIELQVWETFESGYYEFDRNWGFISLETARERFQAGYRMEMAVKIDNRFEDILVMQRIRSRFPSLGENSIISWREFNRSIFGALRVEKTMMFFLVGLIFLVVGVNIFQGLRRSVHERMEDIAVLKVMGASDTDVRTIFVFEGVLIGLLGTLIGLSAGTLISANINRIFSAVEAAVAFLSRQTNFSIFSPSYFYLEEVPVSIIPGELMGICLLSFAAAMISALAASRRVSSLKPREVLNDE